MFAKYRRYVYGSFLLFFILVTPFLVIYSLGFEISLDQQKISNTLNINVETLPRGADIVNNGFNIGKTPLEMKAADGQQVQIGVEFPGYLAEEFVFWSERGTNGSARVTNLTLLPSEPNIINSFENQTPVGILSPSLILFRQESKYFVQGYNLGGVIGLPSEVNNSSNSLIGLTNWEILSENIYWNKKDDVILILVDNRWEFVDLSLLPVESLSVVSSSETQVLILDAQGRLWALDLRTLRLSFIESQINGIHQTKSPNNVWLWREDKIFRLSKGYIENTFFNLNDDPYTQNTDIRQLRGVAELGNEIDFEVASLFQGMMIKIGETAYYIPDFDKNIWQVIGSNINYIGIDTNTIFWLDLENHLFSYNFSLKEGQDFGLIPLTGDPSSYEIAYYFTWRRIMIYSDAEVYSVWFDKDIINRNVVKYSPIRWNQNSCLPEIVDRFQFCFSENNLIAYKNTSFF
ncbi:MAG: PEGA domain-containing protein [Patescibacteria group bacterium]